MKTLLKSALFASAIFAATAASAATVNLTVSNLAFTAGPTFDFAGTLANAQAAEAAFLSSLNGVTVSEGFESLALQVNGNVGSNENTSWVGSGALVAGKSTINTAVGKFVLNTAGQGSSSWTDATNAANNLVLIENDATGEYGRESVSPNKGHWLDSNDAKEIVWTLGSPLSGNFNAFGFYLSDASDVAGKLTLKFADQNTIDFDLVDLLTDKSTNGNVM